MRKSLKTPKKLRTKVSTEFVTQKIYPLSPPPPSVFTQFGCKGGQSCGGIRATPMSKVHQRCCRANHSTAPLGWGCHQRLTHCPVAPGESRKSHLGHVPADDNIGLHVPPPRGSTCCPRGSAVLPLEVHPVQSHEGTVRGLGAALGALLRPKAPAGIGIRHHRHDHRQRRAVACQSGCRETVQERAGHWVWGSGRRKGGERRGTRHGGDSRMRCRT